MRDYWLFTMEFPPWFGGGISTYCLHSIQALKQHYHLTVFVCDDSIAQPQLVTAEDGYRLVRFKIREYYQGASLGAVNISKSFAEVAELVATGAAAVDAATANASVADTDTPTNAGAASSAIPQVIEFHDYMGIGFEMMHQKLKGQGCFGSTLMLVCIHSPVYLLDPVDGLKLSHWPQRVIEKLLPLSLSLAYRLPTLSAFREPKLWLYSLERFCMRHADGLIFISEHLRQRVFQSFGWKDNAASSLRRPKAATIPNPYRLPCSMPVASLGAPGATNAGASAGADSGADAITEAVTELSFFGRLQTWKGVPALVGMLKRRFWDKGVAVRMNLYGRDCYNYLFKMDTGNYLQQAYAPEITAGLLQLHGQVSPEHLAQASAGSTAVVMPSLIENFPYAVCEQMGFGKICLVSHSGGHAEIVEDGVSGFIYMDEDGFEAKLNRIISLTSAERLQMSQAAQHRIQTLCDYNSIYEQKERFIADCLSSDNFA